MNSNSLSNERMLIRSTIIGYHQELPTEACSLNRSIRYETLILILN